MPDAYSVLNDYNGTANLTYYGKALPGTATSTAGWAIMKNTYDSNGNLLTSLWADGNTAMDNIWDNRANLAYS